MDGQQASPDTNGNYQYVSHLLGAGDFIFLPNIKQCGYSQIQHLLQEVNH